MHRIISKLVLLAIFFAMSFTKIICQDGYSIEEQFGQSTIRIIVKKDTNYYVGTGFFFEFEMNKVKKLALITNNHVVTETDTTILKFNRDIKGSPKYGDIVTVNIPNNRFKWIRHPDLAIDLSLLELKPIIDEITKQGTSVYIRSIIESLIPSDSIWNTLTYLEELIMIGYPNGLIDEKNNLPIVRTGTTASQPKLNFNNKDEFITDISNFKGSSGSPIFIKRTPLDLNSKGNQLSFSLIPVYYFVGIHYKGEYFDIEKNQMERANKELIDSNLVQKYLVPLNIGHVIKSKRILDFKKVLFR